MCGRGKAVTYRLDNQQPARAAALQRQQNGGERRRQAAAADGGKGSERHCRTFGLALQRRQQLGALVRIREEERSRMEADLDATAAASQQSDGSAL